MALTNLNVISRACILIGETAVSSLSGTTQKEEIINNTYEHLKLSLMASYPWRFTMKKVQLSQNVTAPVNEWKYAYDNPADALTGGVEELRETDETSGPVITRFEIYGDKVFADEATLYLDYQIEIAESLWPQHFTNACVHMLAAYWADPMTEDSQKADKWWGVAYGPLQLGGGGGIISQMKNVDARISGDFGRRLADHSLISVRG